MIRGIQPPPINAEFFDPRDPKRISPVWLLWLQSIASYALETNSLVFQGSSQAMIQQTLQSSNTATASTPDDILALYWTGVY